MIYSLLGSVLSFKNCRRGGEAAPAPPPSLILQKSEEKLKKKNIQCSYFGLNLEKQILNAKTGKCE